MINNLYHDMSARRCSRISALLLPTLTPSRRCTVAMTAGCVFDSIKRPYFARRFCIDSIVLRDCDGNQLENLIAHPSGAHLKQLELNHCRHLESLEHLAKLRGLQELHIRGCHSLCDVAVLPLLTKLRVLTIRDCMSISVMPPVRSLNTLHSLRVASLPLLEALPALSATLKHLSCTSCWMLQDVSAVGECSELEHLDVHRCQMLSSQGFPNLGELQRLERLDISSCPEIDSLDFMRPAGCPGLRSLNMCETAVEDTSVLKCCTRMETINMWGEDIDYAFAGHLLSIRSSSHDSFADETTLRSCPVPPGTHSPAAAMVIHEWFLREEMGNDFGPLQ